MPSAVGSGSGSWLTSANVHDASASSFWASWTYPAQYRSPCPARAAQICSFSALACDNSSSAAANSCRCTARIELAHVRTRSRDQRNACSRAAFLRSNSERAHASTRSRCRLLTPERSRGACCLCLCFRTPRCARDPPQSCSQRACRHRPAGRCLRCSRHE